MNNKMNNEGKLLKLDYKRTFFIGCAFFSILMLWQVYNFYCPLILEAMLQDRYGADSDQLLYIVGVIMAADNLFALFMLPIFGNLSDKTKTKYGKRMPYIIIGMVLSAIVFPFIAVFFMNGSLVGVIITMGVVLIIMNAYRSPAVALMPDVTPKPLRSTANGIINLVGYIGAIIAGALGMVFKNPSNYYVSFIIAAVFMVFAAIILITTINENKILAQVEEQMQLGEEQSQTLEAVVEDKPLSKADRINLYFLLAAILFWFISFNAVETYNSLFCKKILDNTGIAGTFTIILTVSSIITFAVSSNLANKIGRKWTIVIGLLAIILGIVVIVVYSFTVINKIEILGNGETQLPLSFIIYIGVVFMGVGWALININSYPMIVEMASKKNVGKYTGRYYTFSMIGQTITPILVGLIMSFRTEGLKLLYIYSLVTMVIALIIFMFVKEKRDLVKKQKTGFAAFADPE